MIIGLVGLIGSGKGTVGDLLHTEYYFRQDSFAAPLKDAAAAIFGWPRPLLEGDTGISRHWREQIDEFWSQAFGKPFTPRLALQQLGTEACRHGIHPDIWTASLIKRADGLQHTVVTDCRFPNEVEAIHKEGGLVLHIRRGPLPLWWECAREANCMGTVEARLRLSEFGIHPSETSWVGCPVDAVIHNDGDVDDLKVAVDTVMAGIIGHGKWYGVI